MLVAFEAVHVSGSYLNLAYLFIEDIERAWLLVNSGCPLWFNFSKRLQSRQDLKAKKSQSFLGDGRVTQITF